MLQEIKKHAVKALMIPICVYNKFLNLVVQLFILFYWFKLCLKSPFMLMVHAVEIQALVAGVPISLPKVKNINCVVVNQNQLIIVWS